jgi:hypothetical protein
MRWRRCRWVLVAALALLGAVACGGSETGAPEALSPEDYRTLAETQIPGYTATEVNLTAQSVAITYLSAARSDAGALVQVRVEVRACTPEDCRPLLASEYQGPADQVGLKAVVAGSLAAAPDLHWSYGAVELREGLDGLFARAAGFGDGWVNVYRAWYHDGTTLMVLQTTPAEGPQPTSHDQADALLTPVEAFIATARVFASFAHLFE